jgi:uncharacterized membrane protein
MTARTPGSLQLGLLALLLLTALQIAWHAWLQPPASSRLLPTLTLAALPLLVALWACWGNLRRGLLIGDIVCLFYFCHGIATAYGDVGYARALGFLEIVLSLSVIGASGWDARNYRRKRI